MEPMELPPEMAQAIQQHMERHLMSAENFKHEIQNFLQEISMEHLLTFRKLMGAIAAGGDNLYAAYLDGAAAASLHYRFDVCGTCGVNHAQELLKEGTEEASDRIAEGSAMRGGTQPSLFEKEQKFQQEQEQYFRNCSMYNVEPPGTKFDPEAPVRCKGCGKVYPNLADRMIKKECGDCIHKVKWG